MLPDYFIAKLDSQICTVWKFQDFSITQILREINFEDSRSAKSAILTHFELLNFDFYELLHILKCEIYQMNKTPKSVRSQNRHFLHVKSE